MIDQERVREMTKLAAFEEHEGKQYEKMNHYFRSDFAGRHLIKAFFAGTAACGLVLAMWGVSNYMELMDNLDTLDYVGLGTSILSKYLIFMLVYMVVVDVYANISYAEGQRQFKRYFRRLKRLGRLYENQENHTTLDQDEEKK